MTFDGITKHNGTFYRQALTQVWAKVGDIVEATGHFDRYHNGQPRLSHIVQQVNEVREGGIVRIDGPAGAFECRPGRYTILEPVDKTDLEQCLATLAESAKLFSQGLRPSLGPNRGKPVNTDFQRLSALHSLRDQAQLAVEIDHQIRNNK